MVREWRASAGLSQWQMARMLGTGQTEISLWERGWVQAPRYARMDALAKAMGRPVEELLRETRWAGPFRDPAVPHLSSDLMDVSPDPLADVIEAAKTLKHGELVTLARIARVLGHTT